MKVVRITRFGIRARSLLSSSFRNETLRPRFMERRSLSLACWMGMSRYLAILGSFAMTSMSSSGKSRG